MNSSKFLLFCSCVVCKTEITAQGISQHYHAHHTEKTPVSSCLQCGKPIYRIGYKFCDHSCSATYNTPRNPPRDQASRDRTSKSRKDRFAPYTKIKKCTICGKYHPRVGKTCSDECKSILLSNSMKKKIQSGYNPNKHRGRHKRSWLELSFESWLQKNYPSLEFQTEKPFNRKDMTKTYFADFYFPSLNLIIELDGTQHKKTQVYDQERDQYISEIYDVEIIRISHSEYTKKEKLELIHMRLAV